MGGHCNKRSCYGDGVRIVLGCVGARSRWTNFVRVYRRVRIAELPATPPGMHVLVAEDVIARYRRGPARGEVYSQARSKDPYNPLFRLSLRMMSNSSFRSRRIKLLFYFSLFFLYVFIRYCRFPIFFIVVL